MKRKFTFLIAAIALMAFLVPSKGWGQTTVASYSRSGTANTITGGDFSTTFSAKSGYYQDASGDCYMQIMNSVAYWTTTPSSISFAALIGGGTGDKNLASPVYVSLLDENGDVIAGTQTEVTSHITTNTGDSYDITMPVVNNVYGVKLSHEKESGYNVRYYSFSLSFVAGGSIVSHSLTFGPDVSSHGTVTVGNNLTSPATVAEGTVLDIAATNNLGFVFTNWTVSGTGSSVADATSPSTTFTMGTADATLTANYTNSPTYTVTYYANVTGISPIEEEFNEGDDVTVAANTFINSGHAFVKWNTLEGGTGTDYMPGDVINSIDDDIDLYAQWEQSSDVVDVLNWVATGSPTNYTDWTYTATSGTKYKGQSSGNATGQYIQLRSTNNNSGIVTTTSIGNATKVTVNWNSGTTNGRTLNVYGSNSAYSAASDLYGTDPGDLLGTIVYGTSTELNITGNYAYIGMRSASGAMYLDEIDITWSTGGTPVPSISANNVEIAYDATSGNIAYAINNPVTGGVISTATTDSWITLGSETTSPISFTCAANTEGTPRTATVTLTYTYNTDQTVTKNVTITQAAAPVAYTTIPAIFAAATSTETDVTITFNNWVISGVNGSNAYLTDNAGNGLIIYQSSHGFQVNDVLGGTASCKLVTFKGSAELKNLTATTDGLTVTTGGSVTQQNIAISALTGVNTGALVHYDGLTYDGTNLSDGTNTIKPYNTLFSGMSFESGKTYNVTGIYQQYNTTKELLPRSADDIEEVVTATPSITLDNYTINAPAEGVIGTINATYENITTVAADVFFCEADGTTAATYSWITANINSGNNLEYLVDENTTSDARTAYLKVWAYDDALNEVYSNLVTISQAKYVVDYATLPFIWAGGPKADLTALNGVTANGLGSDYAATNAPYRVKFDTDGDYIQIKTDQQPDVVTIAIKKLGGDGATSISIQGSVDGTTFTTIQDFQNDGDANAVLTHTTTNAFDPSHRYVRILFNKPTGGTNVGVGPISIFPNAPMITVTPDLLEVNSFEHSGSLTATYKMIDFTNIPDVVFFEADGATAATYDHSWILADVNATTHDVDYVIGANSGVARTAYFKVYGIGTDASDVYSNLITVTQDEYVADYATLPFDYEGNGQGVLPSGLTQNGVGSYSTLPPMKFDGTGDYLILKLNEAPTSLSYDIKGNGFSSGSTSTFQVMVSANGTDYDALVTYTELGSTTQSVTHIDLVSTVRYIKWVYTEKGASSGGNVALGNIHASTNYDIYGDVTVANLTIPATKTCTVYSPATLNVTASLTNEATTEAWNNLVIKSGAQLKTPNAVNGTIEKFVAGFGTSTTDKYILLATPATMDACNNTGMWPSDIAQHAHIDFYEFNQSYDEEWRNYKHGYDYFAGPIGFEQGKGYLYANQDDVTLTLQTRGMVGPTTPYEAHPFVATNAPQSVAVSYSTGKEFSGANLIGNPFTCKAYLSDGSRDFYRMNTDGNGIVLATERAIDVCEGIFVLTTASETTVTFQTTDPAVTSTGNNNSMLDITVSQAQATRGEVVAIDAARIRFGEGQSLPKFSFMGNNSGLSIPQSGKDYAVVRSEGQGELPVNFKAATNGTYTIDFSMENVEFNYLHLIDNLTGMDIDLLQTPSYTFAAKTTDYASRFRVVFNANNVSENFNDNFAFIGNGEIILNGINGNTTVQLFDITGRNLSSSNGISRISTENMAAGVYVLRLVNGDNVKTQKIVVK